MCKIYLFIFVMVLNASVLRAQTNPNEYEESPPILMKNELSFGFLLHSSGWGIDFRRGQNLTVSKKRMFEIELTGMHHPKEIKSVNTTYENSKSYVYGKLNSFTVLRGAVGYQRVIAGKAERGGVEIRLNYTGGISLGFAKPIYLNIIKDSYDPDYFILSVEKYDPFFDTLSTAPLVLQVHPDVGAIYGRASFLKGIDEIKIYLGLYAKLGFSFEYGSQEDDVKIIEAGVTFDAYSKTVPIMAFTHNNQLYFNFYINLLYGRKW